MTVKQSALALAAAIRADAERAPDEPMPSRHAHESPWRYGERLAETLGHISVGIAGKVYRVLNNRARVLELADAIEKTAKPRKRAIPRERSPSGIGTLTPATANTPDVMRFSRLDSATIRAVIASDKAEMIQRIRTSAAGVITPGARLRHSQRIECLQRVLVMRGDLAETDLDRVTAPVIVEDLEDIQSDMLASADAQEHSQGPAREDDQRQSAPDPVAPCHAPPDPARGRTFQRGRAKRQYTYAITPAEGGYIIASPDGGGIVLSRRPRGPSLVDAVPPRIFATIDTARDYLRAHDMPEHTTPGDDPPDHEPREDGPQAWTMTRAAWIDAMLSRGRYAARYASDPVARAVRADALAALWHDAIMERAKSAPVSQVALDDICARHGIDGLSPFRGVYSAGRVGYIPPSDAPQAHDAKPDPPPDASEPPGGARAIPHAAPRDRASARPWRTMRTARDATGRDARRTTHRARDPERWHAIQRAPPESCKSC